MTTGRALMIQKGQIYLEVTTLPHKIFQLSQKLQNSALNKIQEEKPQDGDVQAADQKAPSCPSKAASKAVSKQASQAGSNVGSRVASIKALEVNPEPNEERTSLHAKMTNAFTRSATRSVKNIEYSSVDVEE